MKKTIILLFALCAAFGCAAQTFTLSQLKGCKWVSYELDGKVNTVWFTDSAYFDENFYTSLNKTATSKMPFYLSNTIEKVFDESKVGANTSGKYLIVKSGNAKHGFNLVVCEIMGISDTNLSIKYNVYSAKKTIGGVKFVENFTKMQDRTATPYVDAEQLKGGRWQAVDVRKINDDGGHMEVSFTDSLCITDISLYEGSDTVHVKSQYYLSDSKPGTFDQAKVGKATHGKYIVINERRRTLADSTWRYHLVVREIMEASKDRLVIKWDEKNTCTFKRVCAF